MKVGVVSDIHGNLPALEAVLNDLKERSVGGLVCAGDIIGILGWSSECIREIDAYSDYTVHGNHDARLREDFVFTPDFPAARDEHRVTTVQLSETDVSWLNDLPQRIETDDLIVAHSWPKEFRHRDTSVTGFVAGDYGVTPGDFTRAGKAANGKTVILGHTHTQHALDLDKFEGLEGLMLNPGSVGVPWYKDAEYAVVDLDTQEYELCSTEYDNLRVRERLDELEEEYGLMTWNDKMRAAYTED